MAEKKPAVSSLAAFANETYLYGCPMIVTWCDYTVTGLTIAVSELFEPPVPGSLITPGFGDWMYFKTSKGFITMQVAQKQAPASDKLGGRACISHSAY